MNINGNHKDYGKLHAKVSKRFGPAKQYNCEMCGKTAYDWANYSDNYEEINDYHALCRKCHRDYDIKRNARQRKDFRTSVILDQESYRNLKYILLGRRETFTHWIEQRAKEELADL